MSLTATSSFVFLSSARYVSPVPPAVVSHPEMRHLDEDVLPEKGKVGGPVPDIRGWFTLAKLLLEGVVLLKPEARGVNLLGLLLVRCGAVCGDISFCRGGPSAPHALTALTVWAAEATSPESPQCASSALRFCCNNVPVKSGCRRRVS